MDEEHTDRELSKKFYSMIPQLQSIQQKFTVQDLPRQLQTRDIDTEFQLIRSITETKKHKQGLRLCEGLESRKNRYPQQSIYDHSRVCLPLEHTKKSNNISNYINANLVFGKQRATYGLGAMLITQGPLETTTSDFNQMLRKYEITCVIMLCRVIENGKQKCFDYPNSQQWHKIGEYQPDEDLIVTKYQIDGVVSQVTHLYFPNWPDKGVPEDPTQLHPLITEARKHKNILIHCSAGLGRSGVVASILHQIDQYQSDRQGLSIFETVRLLRQSRFGAVQNSQQYRLIYQYLLKYFSQL